MRRWFWAWIFCLSTTKVSYSAIFLNNIHLSSHHHCQFFIPVDSVLKLAEKMSHWSWSTSKMFMIYNKKTFLLSEVKNLKQKIMEPANNIVSRSSLLQCSRSMKISISDLLIFEWNKFKYKKEFINLKHIVIMFWNLFKSHAYFVRS
jgi:hypothetical protein